MAKVAIEVGGLARSFGGTAALSSVDLTLEAGGVFGLLGPNGAGKTTTVRILTGVLQPDSAQRSGCSATSCPARLSRPAARRRADRHRALRAAQRARQPHLLRRALRHAKAEATRSATELLERFGLAERSAEKVGAYSKGMKQKVLIARALVANPDLVFFDEPTAGLDPEAAHELMTYVRDLSRERGKTFFITSHRLEEMETVCTKVGVLAGGRVVAQGSPAEVARAIVPRSASASRPRPARRSTWPRSGAARVYACDATTAARWSRRPRATRSRSSCGRSPRCPIDLLAVAEEPPTLEEAYLRLMSTNHTAAEEVDAA